MGPVAGVDGINSTVERTGVARRRFVRTTALSRGTEQQGLPSGIRGEGREQDAGALVGDGRAPDVAEQPPGGRQQGRGVVGRHRQGRGGTAGLLRQLPPVGVTGPEDMQEGGGLAVAAELAGTDRDERGDDLFQLLVVGDGVGEGARERDGFPGGVLFEHESRCAVELRPQAHPRGPEAAVDQVRVGGDEPREGVDAGGTEFFQSFAPDPPDLPQGRGTEGGADVIGCNQGGGGAGGFCYVVG